jgi:hypothetical protein
MSENSHINEFWELLNATQTRCKGGWPLLSVPPLTLQDQQTSTPSLSVLLKDYGRPGRGCLNPKLVILTEPSLNEQDFEFLQKWLNAIQLNFEQDCYLLEGPPNKDSVGTLVEILRLLKPKALLVLGNQTSEILVGKNLRVESLRDQVREFYHFPMIVTYHPNTVLKDTSLKRPVWKDLQRLDGLIRYG